MPRPAPVVPSVLLVLLKRLHTAYKNLTMPKELFLSSLNQILMSTGENGLLFVRLKIRVHVVVITHSVLQLQLSRLSL